MTTHATSPYRADTDSDGATDALELGAGTDPLLASSQPRPVIAVFSSMATANLTDMLPESAVPPLRATTTGGQATGVGRLGGELDPPPAAGGFVHQPGFQPQTTLARDLDGDGVERLTENENRSSDLLVDTDGDGFVDGLDGVVAFTDPGTQWDLDQGAGAGFVDGELDFGTDPSDADDHPGKPGDVAPLGQPDGTITAGDGSVLLRIVADPEVTDGLSGQNQEIADLASDANEDGALGADDALKVVREAAGSSP